VRIAKISAILFVLALIAWPKKANSQDESTPQTGAASSPSQSTSTAGSEGSATPQEQPDTQPLVGGFMYTLGSIAEMHSFLQPVLSIGEEGFTNPGYTAGASKTFQTTTVPMGGLNLDLFGENNTLAIDYMGAGFIYNNIPGLDSQSHMMTFMDSYRFRRAVVTVGDFFSYTPNANFGFAGIGVLGGFGTGLENGLGFAAGVGGGVGQVNPMFAPNESILTTGFGGYSNTALAELNYMLSARTSVTAMGTFGTLQFGAGSDFLTGNDADGMLGLNHTLSARDTIGVAYIYSTFHYAGRSQAFNSQMADFTYGRKITGRFSLQVYGGPDFVTYTTSPGQTVTSTYISGTANLSYALQRSTLGMYVGRFSSGGSGVIPGAETTTVSGSWQRQVTRTLTASVYGGFSRNSGYAFSPTSPTAATSSASNGRSYDYWFGDVTLNHPISRRISLYFGYEYQRSSAPSCTNASCTLAPSVSNQVVGLGITFMPRPLQL
jgi:hypothetical protein